MRKPTGYQPNRRCARRERTVCRDRCASEARKTKVCASLDHFAVVRVGGAVALTVVLVDPLGGLLEMVLVDIADRDDLGVLAAHECARVPVAHPTTADRADDDPLARRDGSVLAQRRAGDEVRGGDRGRSQERHLLPKVWVIGWYSLRATR